MITYTIREIAVDKITVDYEDGSWAQIPIKASFTKEQIEDGIAQFAPQFDQFETIDAVPFAVGEQNTIKTIAEKKTELDAERIARESKEDSELVTYKEFRLATYPSIGDQLDALYWARKGDTTELDALDAQIQQIKIDYPKNMEPITRAEYQAIIDAASE